MSKDKILQELHDCAEMLKCKDDAMHFALSYARVAHPKHGSILLKPREKQQELISIITSGESIMSKAARQTGQSEAIGVAILWKLLFTQERIVLFAKDARWAMEHLNKVRFAYDNLPEKWKEIYKVQTSNKNEFEIKDAGRIWAYSASSSSLVRGHSLDTVIVVDTAFIENTTMNKLWDSVIPLLYRNAQMVMATSGTVDGSWFQRLWDDIDFIVRKHVMVWNCVPDRDEQFKQLMIEKLGLEHWNREFEVN